MDERPKCEKQTYHLKKRYYRKISLWYRDKEGFLKENPRSTNYKAKKDEMSTPKVRLNTRLET